MIRSTILLNSNLLVLLVVGATSRDYIAKHRRLSAFTVEDYDLLVKLISDSGSVLVTPNTLTETSNLVAQFGEPGRTKVLRALRELIATSKETYVPSRTAAGRPEFLRLGLADSAAIEASSATMTLLTTDVGLYVAAWENGTPAINFNHERDKYL